jgi:hypothetical protein
MRSKIWELNELQCSILGTCLSLGELRRIAKKAGLDLPKDATEFQVHSLFVAVCKVNRPESKAVNKALDRKFSSALFKFSTGKSEEELRLLWRQARDNGEIPGPYWALMSNPNLSEQFQAEVFGEVHMLSHLVGSANRADIRRLSVLEEELDRVQRRWTTAKAAYRKRFKRLEEENKEARRQIGVLAKELETYKTRAAKMANSTLQQENEALLRTLSVQSASLTEASMHNDRLSQEMDDVARRMEQLQRDVAEKEAETTFLETELHRLLASMAPDACPSGCSKAGTPACPGPNLCGKRILYVGGRTNMVQHYRALVERHGGRFEHHDGGVEESRQSLPKILGGVDAVVCPIDCVSHDACQRVKEACRNGVKPLKLVRSSGLSSLAKIIGELADIAESTREAS